MTESTATAPNPAELPQVWVTYIEPFAKAIGKDVNAVTELLKSIAGEPGDMAIEILKDASASPDSDIKAKLNGTPSGVANKAIKLLRGAPQVTQAAAAAFSTLNMLPEVPTTEAWLTALRTGGQLKVDMPTVISATRAALAKRVGLYDIPDKLVERMEAYAESLNEPAPATFFTLRDHITRRDYADIFQAIPGMKGSFVTETRKKELFRRIDGLLWPSIIKFNGLLKAWVESWQQGAANPAMMLNMVASMVTGGVGGAMPPGMMAPPDTGGLRDEAEGFADQVNKVFAGVGVPIARALAYDANRIRDILDDPSLPASIGAPNRDHMLRMLSIDVTATYTRLETNLTRFVLAIMQVKDVPAGNEELQYLGSLYMLGAQIPWTDLDVGRGSLRNTRTTSEDPERDRTNGRVRN